MLFRIVDPGFLVAAALTRFIPSPIIICPPLEVPRLNRTPLPAAVAGSVKNPITVAITLSAGLAASAVGAPPLTSSLTLQSPRNR